MVTPAGELILGSFDGCLCLCDWQYRAKRVAINQRITDGLKAELVAGNNEILTETKRQLAGYFSGKRQTFSIPLLMVGTPFQKQVWEALREINYGKTESYLLLSKRIGNVKAIRAVAAANGANALAIIIPCHRIIGSNGDMVGS